MKNTIKRIAASPPAASRGAPAETAQNDGTSAGKWETPTPTVWQGYLPSAENDGYALFGAKYLYWNGTAVQGGLATGLDESGGAYPALTAYPDAIAAARTYDARNTVGVSAAVTETDLAKYPVVKICYAYKNFNAPDNIGGVFTVNNSSAPRYVNEAFGFEPGAEDEGWATGIADLGALVAAHGEIDHPVDLTHILLTPFDKDYNGDGVFGLRYIAFFADRGRAEAFSSAEQSDYLKNYSVRSEVDYRELDGATRAGYDKLLTDRIAEIRSSESAVTPDDIAEDRVCYYISSVHGDDANDGLSPGTPWKSLENLFCTDKDGTKRSVALAGDGVFFERGSEFYAKVYNRYSVTSLKAADGVFYGAYGEGRKPLFSCAIDFGGGAGNWLATEYENVWMLDEIDPNPEFRGRRADIGNIVINGGQYIGVRVRPEDDEEPFGEGKRTKYLGLSSGGAGYFVNGGSSCANIGEAISHNLEFFHDMKAGRLYFYWDGGNPGEVFDDIKVSRHGYCIMGGSDRTVFDNLAIMYSSTYGAAVGGHDMRMTNCEIGWVGCSISSVESGMECYGESDGTYVSNCYCHDIADGPLTCQNGISHPGDEPKPIKNIEFCDNVIITGGNGVEIWNGQPSNLDENGYMVDKMTDIYVHGNIMAYIGCGLTQQQSVGASGDILCGSIYGEMENCVFEDNLLLYANGDVASAYMAIDTQSRGWQMKGNTYVMNSDHVNFRNGYETVDRINHGMNKRTRIAMPYNLRYLTYFTSRGIDPQGVYYYYTGMTEEERQGCFFTTSYYIERGILPE